MQKESQKYAKGSETAPDSLVRKFQKKIKLYNCNIYVEGLGKKQVCSLTVGSVSMSHYDPRIR